MNMWWSRRSPDEDAIRVFVRMHSGETSPADREFFDRWCRENPGSLETYYELEDLWERLGACAPGLSAEEMTGRLRSSASLRRVPGRGRLTARRTALWAAAAALLIVPAILVIGSSFTGSDAVRYQTMRGEQLVVNLDDGSTVQLNSLSRIEARFDDRVRAVTLFEGEALFTVASDPSRKFLVQTDRGRVEALGTRFNVRAATDDVVVTVLEGTVLVSAEDAKPEQARSEVATRGQQVLVARAGGIQRREAPKLEQVIAWSQGKLIFSGEPLHEAVERVNRHSKHTLLLRDTRLQELPIYGVFNAGDARGFVSALEQAYPLRPVEISASTTVLVYREDGAAGAAPAR